jgi:hypothetical protein
MRLLLLLALCSCTARTLPSFEVPTGLQLKAPRTPDTAADPPGADAVLEENAQYWAPDTAAAYLDGLLTREARFKADGVHRLFHSVPDLKVLIFRVQQGAWVDYLLVDLPDATRKGPSARAWGKATRSGRYMWLDFEPLGHARHGTEPGDVLLYWNCGALTDRTAPAEGDPTKVVQEEFENGKVVSRTVRPRPEIRRNFLNNNAY